MKHKHIEALNRRLSWDRRDRQLPAYARYMGLKSFMCSAWHRQDQRPGGRWVDSDKLDQLRSEPRKDVGNGIEDVEGSALDKLFNSGDIARQYMRAKSQFLNRHPWHGFAMMGHQSTSKSNPEEEAGTEKTAKQNRSVPIDFSVEQEYEIDPITNRKVFKNITAKAGNNKRKAIDVPVKTFKGYRSQFENYQPPSTRASVDIPNAGSTLKSSINAEEMTRQSMNAWEEKHNISYSNKPMPSKRRDTPEEHLKKFDSKMSYNKPFMAYEPDGQRCTLEETDPNREGLKEYDSKVAYGQPFMSHEPDGKYAAQESSNAVRDGLEAYDSKVSYNQPFMSHEPDGKYATQETQDSVDGGLKAYDSRVSYDQPFMAHEPDGKYANHRAHDLEQEGLKAYDSQVSYDQPFMSHEPDGKYADEKSPNRRQKGLEAYDLRASYDQPFMSHEPDGKYAVEETPGQLKEPLPYDSQNSYGPVYHKEAGSTKFKSVDECLQHYERRNPYGPVYHQELDNLSTYPHSVSHSKESEYLDSLRPSDVRASVGNHKSTREPSIAGVSSSDKIKQSRLAVEKHRINLRKREAKARARLTTGSEKPESGEFGPSSVRKMTGNFVRDFPEEFKTTWTTKATGSLVPENVESASENSDRIEKSLAGKESGSAEPTSFSRNPQTPRIQPSLDRNAEQSVTVKATSSENPSATSQRNHAKESSQPGEGDLSFLVSSYSNPSGEKVDAKTTSSASQKTNGQSLGQEIKRIYEDAYGRIDLLHRQTSEASRSTTSESASQEPTLYKILAYDPTMQSISTAETVSIVHDSSASLTPAEVLLRLSNPAKFFPHFEPLQSQGYEIVSGSGDVLVFRKVRTSAPAGIIKEAKSTPRERHSSGRNPIDGMQGSPMPATGNFASPTGFVNHDLPSRSEPVFKSNIDVRREEPVFSGKSNWGDDASSSGKKKAGKGKRLVIGALWLGACSYAVGVVAEFFKTGGIDGMGPQGF